MRTQLLCTFTRQSRLNETLDVIISCNKILYNKVYIFNNVNDSSQLICTYNIELIDDFDTNIHNTISLHRKKQTNTLYTINALNEVIRSKNNGILDKRFNVDWSEYQNTLLLTNDSGLNIIPTKIHQIVDTNTWQD
jgi:hypothetical protein|tara:strand:+ start:5342 stop:5749 length:408 start_codon:yes stop_codon:yes gene_type:complete